MHCLILLVFLCVVNCRIFVLVGNCWPLYEDMMLGKDRMAELRSIAKLHNLAAGSQTVPNSVAEIAAAQGQSPPVGPSNTVALPAPEQKKLPPKRAKRKAPRVVSDEEADETTEDGWICKRRRGVAIELPEAKVAAPDYAENSPSASTPFESAGDVLASNTSAVEASRKPRSRKSSAT